MVVKIGFFVYLYSPLLKRMIAFYSGTLFLKTLCWFFTKSEQKDTGPLALYFYNGVDWF
tara:strand:+ start:10 stop:186 length:177 start_codon:yes stop_codon:yes gene_type:complete